MALYLKYRPQNLDQLIGQERVKNSLQSAFIADKLSHAYLLVGPRGTGKTSTARILAKMVNCESAKNPPCNKCSSCLSITDGSNLDLIEIDAASNRGIDDIRSLRENIKLSPTSSKKKIYIIDEVHMLTTEAFNALLKTLEEPPKHAFFILATTDVQKIPLTILSRVTRLDFSLATIANLEQALQKIITEEKIEIEDEALKMLVKKADGSFRDAVKLLDQLSSSNQKVTVADVSLILQTTNFDDLIQLLSNLSTKKVRESLIIVAEGVNTGKDMKSWILALMETLRHLVLMKNGLGAALVQPEYSTEIYQQLIDLAEKFSIEDLVKTLEALQIAFEKIKFASIVSLPLELAVVQICIEGPEKKVENIKVEEVKSVEESLVAKEIVVEAKYKSSSDDAVSPEVSLLQERWNFVLETVKPYNFSLEALLRLVKILDYNGGTVILEVPYSFHQRILEAPKSRDLLESVLADVLGKPTKVSCVLGAKPMRAEDVANIEVAADDEVVRAAAEIFGTDPIN